MFMLFVTDITNMTAMKSLVVRAALAPFNIET
jgi:hypothetical protein